MILLIIMLVLLAVGIMCIPSSPFAGVAVLGGGFICGSLGILFMMLTVAMAGIATPAIFRGIVSLCRKLSGKKKAEKTECEKKSL